MPILKHFATNTPPNIQKIKKKENVIWENTITDGNGKLTAKL